MHQIHRGMEIAWLAIFIQFHIQHKHSFNRRTKGRQNNINNRTVSILLDIQQLIPFHLHNKRGSFPSGKLRYLDSKLWSSIHVQDKSCYLQENHQTSYESKQPII